MEFLERVHLFAGTDQLDRLAGHRAHRERRAAAAVAVHAGQHEAGNADALVEIARQVDGVLAGQRIGDQQDLVRVGALLDLGHLGHQRLVDMGAAGGVENDHVVAAELGRLHGARGDVGGRLAGDDRQRGDAGLLAQLAELLLCRRPSRVERGHQHFLAVALFQTCGDLGRGRGLARALQADHHDDDGGGSIEIDGDAFVAEQGDQFVMDQLDHHLARLDRLDDLGADGLFAHPVGEAPDHFQRHVGLQERAANLAHGFRHILLRQGAAPGQVVEDGAKPVLESVKHRVVLFLLKRSPAHMGRALRKAKQHPRAHRAVGW